MSRKYSLVGAVTVGFIGLFAGVTIAAAPDAGEVIGNQAAATYESGGQSFTVESNLVETTINQVYAVDIEADQSKTTAPGNFVYFTHVITNNANTNDVINLSATDNGTGAFAFTEVVIFADADSDGQPDNLTPITATPSLGTTAGTNTYSIVVRAQVPASATDTSQATLTVTATSDGDATQTDSVTDTTTVSTGGVVSLQKDQTLATDADGDGVISEGDTVNVVITYENAGLSDALNVNIQDVLPSTNQDGEAITLSYVAGSGVWSDDATALTDGNDGFELTNGSGDQIDYQESGGTVSATLDVVPAGRVGTLSFQYVLTSAEEGDINNIATVTSTAQGTPENSNVSTVTIAPTNAIVLADAEATAVGGPNVGDEGAAELDSSATDSNTDDGTDEDDIVSEATDTFAGGDIRFNLVLTNLSDVSDSFVIDVANTGYSGGTPDTFPTGTVFQLVATGTATPIVGNTVNLAAGEVRSFDVIATLPTNAPADAATDYEATVTATSQADPTVQNRAGILFTGDIIAGTVDLTDETGGTDGVGPFAGGAPSEAVSTDPGVPFTFDMQITVPAGDPSNSFNLTAFSNAGLTNPLPAGWTVEFFDQFGNPITNTGALTPTAGSPAVFDFTAVVTPPAGAPASGLTPQDIYIEAESPTNGVSDVIYYTLSVNEIVDVTIEADTNVQVAPGGVVSIAHTITNNGNSTVTDGAIGFGADTFTDTGMTASLFLDNGDGVLTGADTNISDFSDISGGLAPGATATIFVRVQAPAGATPGTTETGTVTVATTLNTDITTGATDSNTADNDVNDSVEVISGDLTLNKFQGVDAACDGDLADAEDTAFTQGNITADPGQCIVYRIVAANTGTEDATNVIITDATPSFTTSETSCATSCVATAVINGSTSVSVTAPADEATGALTTDPAGVTLTAGDTLTLTFTVQIDQ